MSRCKCGSFAINPSAHGRADGVDLDLCDVCYWRTRYDKLAAAVRALHEQQRQHREDVIHAAMIRAGMCVARKAGVA